MRYTFAQFKTEYPDDDACLEAVFQSRFGDLELCPSCGAETKFYRVKKRQCYACKWCSYQLFPLADTIFRKTTTSLWNWFYAIYLFGVSKNGVSAKELSRHLGVTYKTAWRMAKQIRLLMQQGSDMLGGHGQTVEADEMYVGGKSTRTKWHSEKTPVMGIVERYGNVKAAVVNNVDATMALPFLRSSVERGSTIHTDESRIYSRVKREFDHDFVNHSKKEYARAGVHTNTIEGFWGLVKPSLRGTYRAVSPKYLQSYVNEFVFRYNFRGVAVGPVLLDMAGKRGRLGI